MEVFLFYKWGGGYWMKLCMQTLFFLGSVAGEKFGVHTSKRGYNSLFQPGVLQEDPPLCSPSHLPSKEVKKLLFNTAWPQSGNTERDFPGDICIRSPPCPLFLSISLELQAGGLCKSSDVGAEECFTRAVLLPATPARPAPNHREGVPAVEDESPWGVVLLLPATPLPLSLFLNIWDGARWEFHLFQ